MPSFLLLAALLLAPGLVWAQAPHIEVEALFKEGAVVTINGQRKTLRAGQSFEGVTLVSAYSRTATFEIDGQQHVLGISRRIGSNYQARKDQVATIERNSQLQYQTTALINGRNVEVLVDTGANIVALNSGQATAMGIDYKSGSPSRVETAGGLVKAWRVTLRSVKVGEIRVDNVLASVVEGEFPATVLLGMSFLKHVDLRETNGTLLLSRTW